MAMAMAMAMATAQACTVARPSIAALTSSFKDMSVKNSSLSSAPLSVRPLPALQMSRNLPLQPMAAAGYKLKTHKAAAKRFAVTGSGMIIRRHARKAHLLRKKNAKRRNRLTGKTDVKHCDWQNVIGALPYLRSKK